MYGFPKTVKGRRNRISTYEAALRKEKQTYGAMNDGAGKRYVLTWLYFVVDDLDGGKAHLQWFDIEFDDDVGEPFHKLSGALIRHRLGDEQGARYMLADLMLTNLYIIPYLLSEEAPKDTGWQGSSDAYESYITEMPEEILTAITGEDREWMRQLHDSLDFCRFRKRHIEIHRELENTREFEKRRPLTQEARSLLDELKGS
jgi:hypothetical protein